MREDEYFGSLIADDLKGILRDIREQHRPDTMTADEVSFAENMQNQLREAMNFEGSSEEKKAKALLATLCRTAEYAANPFPASAGSKGITH